MCDKTCPLFGKCGGCSLDFASPTYRADKMRLLPSLPVTGDAVWIDGGMRRRADFCFAGARFGFFARGSKDIVPITHCPNLADEINAILPRLAALPFVGAGGALVTLCDNGVDVGVTSTVPYCTTEFRAAVQGLPVIRVTWNGRTIHQTDVPTVSFGDVSVEYPPNAFLQPTVSGADAIRDMVVRAASGARRVADLFCGLGNFTYALNADGFDVVGPFVNRDLFKKPLTVGMLDSYDCVVMDPPRAGADAQCRELVKSRVHRVIYVSCNPTTFARDARTLTRGGYTLCELTPVDQFTGASHWELVAVFQK